MATSSSSNLSCAICFNPFTDPRILPCLHVYCKSCLEILESQNERTLTCPSCYKTSTSSPSQLPRHLRLEKEVILSNLQDPEVKCDACDGNNKAVSYCEDCSSPICSDCVSSHKRMKLLKGHSVVPLESAKPQPPPVTCNFHPKEVVDRYCISCSSLLCDGCYNDGYHSTHDLGNIDEATSTEKENLRLLLPEIEDCISSVAEAIENIDDVIGGVDENKVKVKEELDKIFKDIVAAVERRHDELLKELEDSAIAKTTQLEMQKEDLSKVTTGLQLAFSAASCACDNFCGLEFLLVKESIERASNDIFENLQLHPVCHSGLDLTINPSPAVDIISSVGRVRTLSQYPPLCSLNDVDLEVAIGVATNCDCLLTLQTRNSRGEDLKEGGARVEAVIMRPLVGKIVDCTVHDLDNGKYEISFTSFSDNCDDCYDELHITVDGIAVQNSPYFIDFLDYCSVSNPTHTVSTDHSPQYIDCGSNCLYISTIQGHIEIYEICELKMKQKIDNSKIGGGNQLRGIAVDEKNGIFFVASGLINQVIKADLKGSIIATVGRRGLGELEFQHPTGLCLTKEGLLLVGDSGNNRVQVLGHDLSLVRSINCRASVWGVSVDPGGNVHVGTTNCVEVFTMEGGKITEYGQQYLYKAGGIQFPNFQNPSNCKFSFVTHSVNNGHIFFYDWTTDTLLHSFDSGNFPLGIGIAQEGTLFVCSYEDRKLSCF